MYRGKNLHTSVNVGHSGTSGLFIYVLYGYDASRAKAMTTFDEYNINIEKYPTLSAFSKVELRFPTVFEDAASDPLLQVHCNSPSDYYCAAVNTTVSLT